MLTGSSQSRQSCRLMEEQGASCIYFCRGSLVVSICRPFLWGVPVPPEEDSPIPYLERHHPDYNPAPGGWSGRGSIQNDNHPQHPVPVQSSHLPSSVPETRVWNAAHYDPGDIISGTSHSWVSPELWVVNQLFLTIAPHTTISPAFFLSSLTDGDVFGAGGGVLLVFWGDC